MLFLLFIDNYDADSKTADLMLADMDGKISCVGKDFNVAKNFCLSNKDEYIMYYIGENIVISDLDGNKINTIDNAKFIDDTVQPALHNASSGMNSYCEKICFDYYLSNISPEGNVANLVFFDGKNTELVDDEVMNIVHHTDEDYLVIYTKKNSEDSIGVFKSVKGKDPVKLIDCKVTDSLFFDDNLNFLYTA